MSWAAAGAAAGSLAGDALGFVSARQANQTNIALSKKQMDFQREMRATQYQTAVADLKAAGLNPMLAYTQGGAGTPSGASAVVEPTMRSDAGSKAVNSAREAIALKNQTDQVQAGVRNIDADTANKLAETERIVADTHLKRNQSVTESYRPQQVTSAAALNQTQEHALKSTLMDTIAKLRADTALSSQSAAQIKSQNVLMKGLQDNPNTSSWAPFLLDALRSRK